MSAALKWAPGTPPSRIDSLGALAYGPAPVAGPRRSEERSGWVARRLYEHPGPHGSQGTSTEVGAMKVVNSLKTAKQRDKNCRIVRRKGRVYVINKKNPRFKARQG